MTFVRRRPFTSVAVVAALVAVATVLTPAIGAAQESPARESDQVAERQALVSINLDVLKAQTVQVSQALSEIKANVDAQTAALSAAQQALAVAKANVAAADAAVRKTQARIDQLLAKTDVVVVQAFVNPPTESALEIFSTPSSASANVKWAILDMQATSDAKLLEQYHNAKVTLNQQKAAKDAAAAKAQARQSEAEAALADTQAAIGQQARFAILVEQRLDQRLSEAEALKNLDPALAAQLRAEQARLASALNAMDKRVQAEVARQLAAELSAQAEANKSAGIQAPPGGVVTVACPDGGGVQVAGDISKQVARLLSDAAANGIVMCGNGYRDPAAQIAVRRSNCGTSTYAIYQMPASSCSPPTARPGTSMHEQGLAIDFTVGGGTIGYGSAGYNWLKANAADYGLSNLAGEPWHWSTNGN